MGKEHLLLHEEVGCNVSTQRLRIEEELNEK